MIEEIGALGDADEMARIDMARAVAEVSGVLGKLAEQGNKDAHLAQEKLVPLAEMLSVSSGLGTQSAGREIDEEIRSRIEYFQSAANHLSVQDFMSAGPIVAELRSLLSGVRQAKKDVSGPQIMQESHDAMARSFNSIRDAELRMKMAAMIGSMCIHVLMETAGLEFARNWTENEVAPPEERLQRLMKRMH